MFFELHRDLRLSFEFIVKASVMRGIRKTTIGNHNLKFPFPHFYTYLTFYLPFILHKNIAAQKIIVNKQHQKLQLSKIINPVFAIITTMTVCDKMSHLNQILNLSRAESDIILVHIEIIITAIVLSYYNIICFCWLDRECCKCTVA